MENAVRPVEVDWNEEAERLLAGATGNEPTYSISDLRSEVQSGLAQLFCWYLEDEKLGYTVMWIDNSFALSELVVQAGAALKGDRRAFRLVMPVIERMGKSYGCYAVRSHLTDGKWSAAFRGHGFYKSEVVMRKRL